MEIEWILQGSESIEFQGFFIELLGLSFELRNSFPHLRLAKAYSNISEAPIPSTSKVWGQLFEQEARTIKFLQENIYLPIEPNMDDEYRSLRFRNMSRILASNICSEQPIKSSINFMADMTRSQINLESSQLCCEFCVSESLCVGWTFQENKCSLKGRDIAKKKINTVTEVALVNSGSFLYNYERRTGRFPVPKAIIFHGTSCVWNNQYILDVPRDSSVIYIGRYMVERMPTSSKGFTSEELHVLSCCSLMDEIWVPTEWNRKALLHYARLLNTKLPSIYIIPEAIDTTLFYPMQRSINSAQRVDTVDDIQIVSVSGDIPYFQETNIANSSNPTKPFLFLSVFKWEYRKGWDILLTSYWNEFQVSDHVMLLLHTYKPPYLPGGHENITAVIEEFAYSKFNKSLHQLPAVLVDYDQVMNERLSSPSWIGSDACTNHKEEMTHVEEHSKTNKRRKTLRQEGDDDDNGSVDKRYMSMESSSEKTRYQMRELYSICDAFVLPTRGEGWGLPIAEAMSSGLPVIVTNATGPMAFANDGNAFMISVEKNGVVDDMNGQKEDKLDDLGYVIPRGGHLSEQMRYVFDHRLEAREKGHQGRLAMQALSPQYVVNLIADRLLAQAEIRGFMQY